MRVRAELIRFLDHPLHARAADWLLVPGLLALWLLGASSTSFAYTWVVDEAGGGDTTDLQPALDSALPGDTVLIRPGTYFAPPTGFDLLGKTLTVTSSDGPEQTRLDFSGADSGMRLVTGEGPQTLISGLTFQSCYGTCIELAQVSPTLEHLVITNSFSFVEGSGLYIEGGAPILHDITTYYTTSYPGGGSIYASNAVVEISSSHFNDALTLGAGGAIEAVASTLVLSDVVFARSYAGLLGGAIALEEGSQLQASRVAFLDGTAGSGSGLWLQNSSAALTQLLGLGNRGVDAGLLACDASTLALTNATLVDNAAEGSGGAIWGHDCSLSVDSSILAWNRAPSGGAIALAITPEEQPTPEPEPTPGRLEADASPTPVVTPSPMPLVSMPLVSVAWSRFWQNGAVPTAGLDLAALLNDPALGNREEDPRFQRFLPDLASGDSPLLFGEEPPTAEDRALIDDLHLLPDSMARDAGNPDPLFSDPDLSRNDIGYTGGPLADLSWGEDPDGDGLPSGWESAHGLDSANPDGMLDPDLDGLTSSQEYALGLMPDLADSDGDLLSDGDEVRSGADPNDAFSPQGELTLPHLRFASVQAAVNAVRQSGSILLEPGSYPGPVDTLGKALLLRASQPGNPETAGETLLTSTGTTLVLQSVLGEGTETRIEGLTLRGGSAVEGGCARISRSSPTLRSLRLEGCTADSGGAMAVASTSLLLESLVFVDNEASLGGALYGRDAHLALRQVQFLSNRAVYPARGGAIGLDGGSLRAEASRFEGNSSEDFGGALSALGAQVQLEDTGFIGNQAQEKGGSVHLEDATFFGARVTSQGDLAQTVGGFAYALGGTFELQQSRIVGGEAGESGGGLYLVPSQTASLRNVILQDCQAQVGGAIALELAEVEPGQPVPGLAFEGEFLTLVGNQASTSGAAFSTGNVEAYLGNSILAFNASPTNPEVAEGAMGMDFTLLYGNRGGGISASFLNTLGTANMMADPRFVSYVDDLSPPDAGDPPDELHLLPDSPAGDSAYPEAAPDPDGSPPDRGAYGGSLADPTWSEDADADGLPDGWETLVGLDPAAPSDALDSDGDGLTSLEEYQAGTSPSATDTDHDGLSDAQEVLNGTDGRSAFDPSGQVIVPETFASIQAAIDAAPLQGRIRIGPGTYSEHLELLGKDLELIGEAGAVSTVVRPSDRGSVLAIHLGESPAALIKGLTLTGGEADSGGGLRIEAASPRIEQVIIQGNVAGFGGGAAVSGSPTFTDVQLLSNQATDRGRGGGMLITGGQVQLKRVTFGGNTAFMGGGLHVSSGSVVGEQVLLIGNQAGSGAGLGLEGSSTQATFLQSTFHANTAGNGAGAYVSEATLHLENSQITGNLGPVGAGLDTQNGGVLEIASTNLWSNHGANTSLEAGEVVGEHGNGSLDPRYETFTDDGVWTNDNLHLRPDSPVMDAGVGAFDADGSAAELGVYGGPGADRSWYADLDQDGIYDGWETAHGLNPSAPDQAADPDGDGLNNALEFEHGLDPQSMDSDGDTLLDPIELETGTDGTDFFSPQDDVVVTEFFPSLQAGLNAARDGVTLRVPEGSYTERLDFRGKQVALIALGDPEQTRLIGDGGGSVVVFRAGETRATRLEGFTITGGVAVDGGGIRVAQSAPTLHRLIIRDNVAENTGGGISVSAGDPLISHSLVVGNSAESGGGIAGGGSTLTLINLTLVNNVASANGGGLRCLDLCSVTLLNSIVAQNIGVTGAGVTFILPATLTLEYNDVWGNVPTDYSGVLDPTGRKGNLQEDPGFAEPEAVGWVDRTTLSLTSPCLDAGTDASAFTASEDLLTHSRPFDGDGDGSATWDMGALELEVDRDGDGYLVSDGDCDEGDAQLYPGALETCDDGIDQSCDGLDLSCLEVDNDGDGSSETQGDCNDLDPAQGPGALEIPANGIDDNCDGVLLDEPSPTPTPEDASGGCACRQGNQEERSSTGAGLLLALGGLLSWTGRRRGSRGVF